jgi:hypothetical protein
MMDFPRWGIASLKIQRVPPKPLASSRRTWACWGIAIPGSSHRRQALIQLGRDVLGGHSL